MKLKNQLSGMDEVWIELASNGDLDAFNQLVLKHQDLAYRHAVSMLNDDWLAEDVVQEGFVKAFQKMPSFRGGSFRAWLVRIVTNAAYDMLRQSSRRPVQPLFPEDDEGEYVESPKWLADPTAKVEEAVEWSEEVKLVYEALGELADIYREIIILVDLQEFDYEEAAQALDIPIGTVKSRLARARLYLREKLKSRVETGITMADASLCLAVY